MPFQYVIGFDVGGTRLKCGAMLRDGTLKSTNIVPSGYGLPPHRFMEVVIDNIRRIDQELGGPPQCVALGFPGAVKPDRGIVLLPGKLQLEGYPVVRDLQMVLDVPVVADNDGRISILGEARYGKAQLERWAVSITLGTGVGSGVMLDGHILRDPHLQFGTQASHITQDSASDRLCITGGRGTANILCSALALSIAVRDGLARGLPSSLYEKYHHDPKSIDFQAVIEGVIHQDPLCLDALDRWTNHLGRFLTNVFHIYAPEIIILSGGATAASDHFLPQVREFVTQHVYRYPVGEPVRIEISKLGELAGVYGATALAWEYLEGTGA